MTYIFAHRCEVSVPFTKHYSGLQRDIVTIRTYIVSNDQNTNDRS